MTKNLSFFVWSNDDPNDSFTVVADTQESALYKALAELGWSISEGEECDEVEEE